MKIENKNVRRNFFWGDGRFYTTDIVNKRAGVMIKNCFERRIYHYIGEWYKTFFKSFFSNR